MLVDTYGSESGVNNAIRTAKRFGAGSVGAIRIDSGNFRNESWQARIKLDTVGLTDVRIVASGGLDEYQITELVAVERTNRRLRLRNRNRRSARRLQRWTPPTSLSSTTAGQSENCLLVSRASVLANRSGGWPTTTWSDAGTACRRRQASHF